MTWRGGVPFFIFFSKFSLFLFTSRWAPVFISVDTRTSLIASSSGKRGTGTGVDGGDAGRAAVLVVSTLTGFTTAVGLETSDVDGGRSSGGQRTT